MPLQLAPPLALSQVETEFSAPSGTPLSDFLRGGPFVPDSPANAGIPSALPLQLLDLLGGDSVLVFPQLGLQWQADVNTRGRTDNTAFEHVGAAVGTNLGAPLPAVGAAGDGGLVPMFFADLGTGNILLSTPQGGFNFMDGPFTFAFRVRNSVDHGALSQPNDYIGGFGRADLAPGLCQGSYLIGNSGGDIRVEYRTPGGNSTTRHSEPPRLDDGTEHVIVFRELTGIPNTTHEMFTDAVLVDSNDQAGMTANTLDEARWAFNWLDGTEFGRDLDIFWMAFWDFAVSNADIALLSASPNPFI